MVMEDIDLGDRRGLIDLIYGQPQKDIGNTPSASNSTLAPLSENKKNQKKKKSQVVCSFPTAVMLFLIAAASVFLCGFIAYWLTRQQFEMKMAEVNYVPQPRRNITQLSQVGDLYEEEAPSPGPTAEELRLPQNVEPIWYNLTLKAYLPGVSAVANENNLTTDGNIMIKLSVRSTTDEITLNAKDLSFPSDISKIKILKEEMEIEDLSREEMANVTDLIATPTTTTVLRPFGAKVKKILYNSTLEKVVFTLDKPLPSGEEVIVQLPFGGRITENSDGIQFLKYRTKMGDKKIVTFTSLRTGSTRSIYPCLDEPQFNAPLSLTIIHPKGTTVTAGTTKRDDSSQMTEPLWDKTSFDATPAIPTHLTGFAISDFENEESTTRTGLKISVFSRPEAKNSTTYALETATKVVDLLQEYFNVPFGGDKLDLFAIPAMVDLSIGGQGIIFLSEENMLLQPMDGVEQELKVAQAICQQVTRQWFGNLVSPSDYHALWLNEGFANYMEYFLLEKIFGEDFDEQSYRTSESLEPAFVDDARSTSHPLTLNIETLEEAQEILDQVTAKKGGALLHMIRAVVGEEIFQQGIQNFLTTHAKESANYTDFWNALDNAITGKLNAWDGNELKIADFAEKWILQMGYPVVEVYRIDANTIELTQRRFKLDYLTPEQAKFRNALFWYKWDIPIFYEVNGKKMDMIWLHEATRLPMNISDTLLINPESQGYYRVNYDEQMWIAIADQLKKDHKKFPPSARARILSDAMALADAELLPYELVFGIISYLPNESDYLPWTTAVRGLKSLYRRLSKTKLEENAKKFVSEKIVEFFNTLDLDDLTIPEKSKILESQMRKELAELYCDLSSEDCDKKLVAQFERNFLTACDGKDISSECSKVPTFIRSWIYCIGIANGGQREFNRIHKLSTMEVDAVEKKRLLAALSCSRDPRKLRKQLYEIVLPEKSPTLETDVQNLVENMNNHDVGAEIVSDFMLDNWKELIERFSRDRIALSNVLRGAIRLESERDIKQFERFLIDHRSTAFGLQGVKVQLEKARNQMNWLKKNKETMKILLSSRRPRTEL